MAKIIFYEKPGCKNNVKQKKLLKAAGHEVEAHNLLEHSWTEAELKPFIQIKPASDPFNPNAPAVKNGEVVPAQFTYQSAIQAMIKEPILIKRPLMIIDGQYYVQGFDKEYLKALICLEAAEGSEEEFNKLNNQDIVTCHSETTGQNCDGEELVSGGCG